MVPLKLNGCYRDYGYDDCTVNSFWNLNLLESTLNKTAGDKKPEDKWKVAWEKSCIKSYPQITENARERMKAEREEKMKQMYESFCDFCNLSTSGACKNKILDDHIVSYIKEGVHFGKVSAEEPGEQKNKTFSVYTISFVGGKIDLPAIKRENNAAKEYFFQLKDNSLALPLSEEWPNPGKAEAIGVFRKLAKMVATEKDVDKLICDFAWEENNQKHVSNLILIPVDGYTLEKSTKDRISDKITEGGFYLNTNTDISTMCVAARKLYEKLETEGVRFGFWVELTSPEMHYIRGARYLTHYRNIGDTKMYEEFVQKQSIKDQLVENSDMPVAEAPVEFIENHLFLRAEQMKICDILKKSLKIPEYQRAYVWRAKQFRELVKSIEKGRSLGTIILYEIDGAYSVVDGQQRLTTLGSLGQVLGLDCVLYNDIAKDFFEDFKNLNKGGTADIKKKFEKISLDILIIKKEAPITFQYKVFGSINGCGRRLTPTEMVKNYLYGLYPDEKLTQAYIKSVNRIITSPGFIKAYCEMRCGEHISEPELYDTFKRKFPNELNNQKIKKSVQDYLYNLAVLYDCIKGIGDTKIWNSNLEKTRELKLWLRMYQMLEINTADAILLHMFDILKAGQKELKEDELTELEKFSRQLVMLYFLLYVDDPNGNSKKSINSKLPQQIKSKCSRDKLVLDTQLFTEGDKTDYVFEKLAAFDLARNTRKAVARFILMLCELWCGLDVKIALKQIESKKQSEIEHIFPANPDSENLRDMDTNVPESLFRLQNVCLLEANINKAVGNKKLRDKLTGKGKKKGEDINYRNSEFVMPSMFYNNNRMKWMSMNGFYGSEQASERMKVIKRTITENELFRKMLDEFLYETSSETK